VSGSGIRWAICKSAPRSRQITTPTHHHSVFLQAGCPSCRPTNSVKGPKAVRSSIHVEANSHRHARHDTDGTVLSCLVRRCELSRLDRQTGAIFLIFLNIVKLTMRSVMCRSASGGAVRPPNALPTCDCLVHFARLANTQPKRRRKCTRQSRSCLQLFQIFTD